MNEYIEKYSKDGQIIYHGDALKVLESIPDESIDLIFVDHHTILGRILRVEKTNGKQTRSI